MPAASCSIGDLTVELFHTLNDKNKKTIKVVNKESAYNPTLNERQRSLEEGLA